MSKVCPIYFHIKQADETFYDYIFIFLRFLKFIPILVIRMENAAILCVAPHLPEGSTTVGSMISSSHIKPSAIGANVEATAELVEIENRKLTFKVTATENGELIGEGTHIRYIVDRERFLSKL